MKISSILFIGFFSVIGLAMSMFLIPADEEYLNSKGSHFANSHEYEGRNFNIPNFTYLKVMPDCKVRIRTVQDSIWHFNQNQLKDSAKILPEYHMSGDTLIITSTRAYYQNEINLYSGDIAMVESMGEVYLESAQRQLTIHMNGGRVILERKQQANQVSFQGEGGRFDCWSDSLQVLDVNLTDMYFECSSRQLTDLNVQAQNSEVRSRIPLNMNIHRDESSKFHIIY